MPSPDQLQNREDAVANIAAGRQQNTGITVGGSNTIPVNSFEKAETPIQLPPEPQPVDNLSIIKGIPSVEVADKEVKGAEGTQSLLRNEIFDTLGTLSGRAAATAEAEQEAGLPGFEENLRGVNSRLTALRNESLAIPLQIQEESKGRGRTAGGVAPIETGRLRQNAIQSLSLSAQSQALQGDITGARDSVDRQMDLEFGPEEEKLEFLKQAYLFNREDLERADKKRADALNLFVNERERVLKDAKEDKRYSNNLMLQATQAGMPTDQAEKMANMSPEDAIAFGAEYFGADFKRQAEQQAFENGIKTRGIAIQEASFALQQRTALLARAQAGDQQAIDELGYDPTDLPLSYDEQQTFEGEKIRMEGDIEDIKTAMSNKTGLDASSGLVRGVVSLAGQALDPKGGVFGIPNVATKRNSFMATARYVVNNLTLNMVGELGERGIKLTPISEAEILLMGQASRRLVSGGDYGDDGTLKGFTLSSQEVEKEMTDILASYERLLSSIEVDMTLTDADKREIMK